MLFFFNFWSLKPWIRIGSGSVLTYSLYLWIRIRKKWIRIRNTEKNSFVIKKPRPGSGMDPDSATAWIRIQWIRIRNTAKAQKPVPGRYGKNYIQSLNLKQRYGKGYCTDEHRTVPVRYTFMNADQQDRSVGNSVPYLLECSRWHRNERQWL